MVRFIMNPDCVLVDTGRSRASWLA